MKPSILEDNGIKTYLVGGAVRDQLLGLPVKDRDWVVVGATPQQMISLGFLPVGKTFPVFLHPQTKEEYALARTERKIGHGYHGFTFYTNPTITLEEDLARRDLTINAIAMDKQGVWIDPYGGVQDIKNQILRHVSLAFAEDPVRILRLSRFYARFKDFSIHPQTLSLIQQMVQNREVESLVPERIWQELSQGLMESQPSRMFEALRFGGVLKHILPELDALWRVCQRVDYHPEIDTGIHVMMVLDYAAKIHAPLEVRFACLTHDLGKVNTPKSLLPSHPGHEQGSVKILEKLRHRLPIPKMCYQIAIIVAREHGHIHTCMSFSAKAILGLLNRCDAIRRPKRFQAILLACLCDARGRLGKEKTPYPQEDYLQKALQAAKSIPIQAIIKKAQTKNIPPQELAQQIEDERSRAIARAL